MVAIVWIMIASAFPKMLPNRRRGWFMRCTDACLALQAVAKAEGIAQEFQDVTAKGEAVEQAAGEALVAQHLHPVAEGQVGGDEHRDPFMQRRTELKEQLGAAGREGHIAELIQDDEVMAQRLVEIVRQLMGRLRLLEFIDELSDREEAHAAILAAGG